ncbi:hypothetical protein K9M78_01080 [Candidatus Bipolaricaulota bacterium]|nr:hypothetical protein [Candidatus Bipolaricaulota bacterium]
MEIVVTILPNEINLNLLKNFRLTFWKKMKELPVRRHVIGGLDIKVFG